MQKMGVLGGTFDPIHEGHIALAKEALRHGGLDGVIFLPMAHPAHREANASADDRMSMCALAPALPVWTRVCSPSPLWSSPADRNGGSP